MVWRTCSGTAALRPAQWVLSAAGGWTCAPATGSTAAPPFSTDGFAEAILSLAGDGHDVLWFRLALPFVVGTAGPAETAGSAAAVLPYQHYNPVIAEGALVAHPRGLFLNDEGGEGGGQRRGRE